MGSFEAREVRWVREDGPTITLITFFSFLAFFSLLTLIFFSIPYSGEGVKKERWVREVREDGLIIPLITFFSFLTSMAISIPDSERRVDPLQQRRSLIHQPRVHLHQVRTGIPPFHGGFGTVDTAHADDPHGLAPAFPPTT